MISSIYKAKCLTQGTLPHTPHHGMHTHIFSTPPPRLTQCVRLRQSTNRPKARRVMMLFAVYTYTRICKQVRGVMHIGKWPQCWTSHYTRYVRRRQRQQISLSNLYITYISIINACSCFICTLEFV